MKIKKTLSFFSFFLTLSLIAFISASHAATISGSIYQSDGTTLITGTSIQVHVYQGDPCHCHNWVGFATTTTGLYTTIDLPEGTYYLQTSNMNQSNYVDEWWADPLSVISCSDAQTLTVSTSDIAGIDFQLDGGYSISGVIYQSDGITPIPDNNVEVLAYSGDPCDDREWMGYADTSSGVYSMMGIPPGDYYIQTSNMAHSIYADEWWADLESVFYCSEAQTVTMANANITGKNFQLDIGGIVTGVVVNDSGAPQADFEVRYSNDLCKVWKSANTAIDGSFELIGLPPGPVEIEIEPDVDTWLVKYEKTYSCLSLGENSDLGTIELPYGALITGVVKDAYSNPLHDVDVWCGSKFEVAWDETDVDGSFALRVPVGTYTLNFGDVDEQSAMPTEITVNDVGTPQNLGILTVYDSSSGELISGTVDDGGYSGTGEFTVLAFLNTTELTPENFGGIQPLATAEPDQATGNYSLYVVPQAERPGTTIKIMLSLLKEGSDDWLWSETMVDKIEGIITSETPVPGQDLAYSTSGSDYTVSGFVKDVEGGIVDATVFLYKQPGDEFFGFAETDCDGSYTLYNVPAGSYRTAATAYGYDATEWTATFNVIDTNVTVPDIFMGSSPGDELAVDFGGNGLWHYDGGTWNQLNGQNPEGMKEWDGGLASDFGTSGLWNYDGSSWNLLTTLNPESMRAWNYGLAVDFSTTGLWNYNGSSWDLLTTNDPQDMESWTDGLTVDFSTFGLWNYDGSSWDLLTTSDAQDMQAWANGLAVDFGTFGLWSYNGSSWDLLTTSDAQSMESWSGGLAVNFDTFGLWNYNGSSWGLLTTSNAEYMAAWAEGLAVDFGGIGLWSYYGSSWDLLTTSDAQDMEGWATSLAVDLGASGLWNYDGSSWENLTGWDSEDIIDVDLY